MSSTLVPGVLKYINEQILSSHEMQNRHSILKKKKKKMQCLFLRKNNNALGEEGNFLILIKSSTKF